MTKTKDGSTEKITPMRQEFPHLQKQDDGNAAEKFAKKHKKVKGRIK